MIAISRFKQAPPTVAPAPAVESPLQQTDRGDEVVPEEERQQQQPSSLKDPWCTLQIELNETTGEAHVSLSLSNTQYAQQGTRG